LGVRNRTESGAGTARTGAGKLERIIASGFGKRFCSLIRRGFITRPVKRSKTRINIGIYPVKIKRSDIGSSGQFYDIRTL
jgi:hypothetical protein